MDMLPDCVVADEFTPSLEDEAWAAAAFAEPDGPAVAPINSQPATLAEYVDDEARSYRARGTEWAVFVADHLARLGQLIRWTGATTPEEHGERMEVWDEEIRIREFDRGYAEGVETTRRELAPYLPDRPC